MVPQVKKDGSYWTEAGHVADVGQERVTYTCYNVTGQDPISMHSSVLAGMRINLVYLTCIN